MRRLASAVAVTAVLVLVPVGLAGTASAQGTYYASCRDAAAVGVYDIRRGESGYREELDRDGDGIACESGESSSGSGSGSGSGSNSGSSSGSDSGSSGDDESVSSSGSSRPDQVTVVPEGGAETGDGSTENGPTGSVGGSLLAALTGLLGVRRTRARA